MVRLDKNKGHSDGRSQHEFVGVDADFGTKTGKPCLKNVDIYFLGCDIGGAKELGVIYFPTNWGAKEPQNPPNHRVVFFKLVLNGIATGYDVILQPIPLIVFLLSSFPTMTTWYWKGVTSNKKWSQLSNFFQSAVQTLLLY